MDSLLINILLDLFCSCVSKKSWDLLCTKWAWPVCVSLCTSVQKQLLRPLSFIFPQTIATSCFLPVHDNDTSLLGNLVLSLTHYPPPLPLRPQVILSFSKSSFQVSLVRIKKLCYFSKLCVGLARRVWNSGAGPGQLWTPVRKSAVQCAGEAGGQHPRLRGAGSCGGARGLLQPPVNDETGGVAAQQLRQHVHHLRHRRQCDPLVRCSRRNVSTAQWKNRLRCNKLGIEVNNGIFHTLLTELFFRIFVVVSERWAETTMRHTLCCSTRTVRQRSLSSPVLFSSSPPPSGSWQQPPVHKYSWDEKICTGQNQRVTDSVKNLDPIYITIFYQ